MFKRSSYIVLGLLILLVVAEDCFAPPPAKPDMDITGNSVIIADGDLTPDVADDTDFGTVAVSGGTAVHTFTIENTGDANLVLEGSPLVGISGTEAADFTVTVEPALTTLTPGQQATFEIQFDPGASGLRSASLSVPTNVQGGKGDYTFSIQGTGGSSAVAPTVANPGITTVEDTTATLDGEVTDTGGATVTERGVYWSTTQGFTPPGQGTKDSTTGSWATPSTFSENVTGLTESALIYFQAFATNSDGNGFSSEASFQTEPSTQASSITFPVVGTDSVTISWNAGSGDGALVIMKQSSTVTQAPVDGSEHSFDTAFGNATTDLGGSEYVVYRGSAGSVDITNLQADTTYYVKVFEYAGSGTGFAGINYQQDGVLEASQKTDAVGPSVPIVGNTSIAAVEDTNATLGGEVTAANSLPVTERGIYWSTTQGFTPPGQGTKVSTTGSWNTIPLVFTENVTGLTESDLIYFKAFAVDGAGEGYSAEAVFQTEPTTQANTILFPVVDSTSMTVSWTAGSGDGALVIMKQGSTVTQAPVDENEHSFDLAFGNGTTDLGGGEYVVYRGPANSASITNLQAETTYFVKVFEYAGSGTGIEGINYQQDTVEEANETTAADTGTSSHNAIRNINCDQCHAMHVELVPRDANQMTVCTTCHNATDMGAENTHLWDINVHTVNGGSVIIDCGSCHDVHEYDFTTDNTAHGGIIAENRSRIRWDTDKYMGGIPLDIALEPAVFHDVNEFTFTASPWNGICQSCHTSTDHHRNYDDPNTDHTHPAEISGSAGKSCIDCHTHSGGFQPVGGGGCTSCHSSDADNSDGTPTRRAVVSEFSSASHHVAGGTATDADCKVCHYEAVDSDYHKNNLVDLRDPDTGSAITGFTKFTRDRSSDVLESWIINIQNNFCLKCHDSDGATATFDPNGSALRPFSSDGGADVTDVASQFSTGNNFYHPVSGTVSNPYCIPSGSNGNTITMVSPWNQDATHDQITCFDCHGDIATDPDATGNLINAHGGGNQRMLRTSIDFNGIEAAGAISDVGSIPASAGTDTETFCSLCHTSSVYVSGDTGSIFEYHGTDQNQHGAAGGNELGCMGCHAGIVNFGDAPKGGGANYPNGATRGNIHGGNFDWSTTTSFATGQTEYFMLGGWIGGWQINGADGECSGGGCNHSGTSRAGKSYTLTSD